MFNREVILINVREIRKINCLQNYDFCVNRQKLYLLIQKKKINKLVKLCSFDELIFGSFISTNINSIPMKLPRKSEFNNPQTYCY